jgi:hypothetical protein
MTDSFLAMVVDRVDGCIEFQPRVVAIGYEIGVARAAEWAASR